jgi:RimJ/RimL family protein N-acetyltransferase
MPFYPADAATPAELRTEEFMLRMLRARDAALDYDAVMASRERLWQRSASLWPREGFTLAENLADLEEHEAEFHARVAFAYTMMNPDESECLGCVYINPLARILQRVGAPTADLACTRDDEAEASFWVRQSREADDLDKRLLAVLLPWLRRDFAFVRVVLRAFAAEERQVAIFEEAGLQVVATYPAGDTQLLLFA